MYRVWEQCLKKRGKYVSEEIALKNLERYISLGYHKPGEMIPYDCPYCHQWHLGHAVKLKQKEKNEFLNLMSTLKVKKT